MNEESQEVAWVVVPLFILGSIAWNRWSNSDIGRYTGTVDKQRELSRSAGMAVDYETLKKRLVRNEPNAAPLYRKMLSEMGANSKAVDDCRKVGTPPPKVEALLAAESKTLEKVRSASLIPYCNFEYQWEQVHDLLMPEFGPISITVKKLLLRCVWNARHRRPEVAIGDVETILRIGAQLDQDPSQFAKEISVRTRILYRHDG